MIKLIKYSVFLICIFLSTLTVSAQNICQIQFLDESGQPNSEAAAKIFYKDVFFEGAYTDSLGRVEFSFSELGEYSLEVSSIGFESLDTIIILQKELEEFTFVLATQAVELGTVTVSAFREIVKREDEALVLEINGKNTLGSNIADILRNAPGIDLSNNSIEFLGKSVLIFIDGKQTNLRGSKLINYLKNKKSQQIESIEMILNPDSSYDAAFDGRVIMIKTQKKIGDGYEFSLYSKLNRNRDYYSPDVSGDFHIRRGKLSMYSDLGYYVSNRIERSTENRILKDTPGQLTFDENSVDDYSYRGPYFESGVDYNINENSVIGVKWETSFDKEEGTIDSKTDISSFGALDSFILNDNRTFEEIDFSNVNVNYNTSLDSGTLKINIDADYGKQIGKYGTDQNIEVRSISNLELSNGINQQNLKVENDFFAGKIDLVKKLDKFSISAGTKYAKSKSLQDIDELLQTTIINSPRYLDLIRYNESIFSTFVNIKGKIGGYFFSIGSRYENTKYTGSANSIIDTLNNAYSKLFPQLVLSKRANNHVFSLSYKQSIRRPSYDQLIPYKRFTSATYYYTGNPNLRAYFPNAYEFLYTYKNNFILKVANRNVKNRILEFNRQIVGTLLTEGTKQNNGSSDVYLLSMSYNKKISSKIYLKTRASYVKGKQKADLQETEEFSYNAYTFTIAPRFAITDKLNLSLYWYYSSDTYFGVSQNLNYWFLNFDLSYELFDGDAEVSFGGRDVFLKSITRTEADYGNLLETSSNDWGSRQFILSFSYYFESEDIKSQRSRSKTANQESIQRL